MARAVVSSSSSYTATTQGRSGPPAKFVNSSYAWIRRRVAGDSAMVSCLCIAPVSIYKNACQVATRYASSIVRLTGLVTVQRRTLPGRAAGVALVREESEFAHVRPVHQQRG